VLIHRLAPSEAFLGLLTHAYCYSLEDAERNRRMMAQYLELAQAVPVFNVAFRPGFEILPSLLDAIEREVGMSVPAVA
jgi:hypothetical protein